jgi:hypothetical protein
MTEPKPEWQIDMEAADAVPGDMVRMWMVERRRALISELRALERMLGMEQSIPQRERAH